MIDCRICGKKLSVITNTHLRSAHQITIRDYINHFGQHVGVGFPRVGFQLSKNDPRYARWRKKLLQRPPSWSKGYTKETHFSVAKISKTFREKKIDNFAHWREGAKRTGLFPAFGQSPLHLQIIFCK